MRIKYFGVFFLTLFSFDQYFSLKKGVRSDNIMAYLMDSAKTVNYKKNPLNLYLKLKHYLIN